MACDLYVSVLQRLGFEEDRFGTSVSDLNERFGSTKYTIPAYMRVQAPVRVFSMLNRLQYENVDSPKGRAVLWGAYAGSLVLIAGVLVIAPRWLFVDEDRSRSMYAGKKGR